MMPLEPIRDDDDSDDYNGPKRSPYHWTDQELIEELTNRERLIVVTAKQEVPRSMISKDGVYRACLYKLGRDLGDHCVESNFISDDSVDIDRLTVEFSGTIIILSKETIPTEVT